MKIPFFRQEKSFKDKAYDKLKEVMDSERFVKGPEATAFAKEFAAKHGFRYAVPTSSGSMALLAGVKSLPGYRESIVFAPASTTQPSIGPLLIAGVDKLAIYDIIKDNVNWDMPRDPDKTFYFMAVHLHGELTSLPHFTVDSEIPIIEDACHAHGLEGVGDTLAKQRLNHPSYFTFYSFFPTKNCTTLGEGGMLCTNYREIAEKAQAFIDVGRIGKGQTEVEALNGRMSELHATVGRESLSRLDRWNQARIRIAKAVLDDKFPKTPNVFHHLVLRVGREKRDQHMSDFKDLGIPTVVHYPTPLNILHGGRPCPWAENDSQRKFSLPIYPDMTDEELDYLVESVKKVTGDDFD